jgi:IS30 family transposase
MKHHRKPELIARIRAMLNAGASQAEIAEKLGKAKSTIAFHVRNLGVKPVEYSSPKPERKGKRKCVTCGKAKTAGAFPSKYNAECSMCIRGKK